MILELKLVIAPLPVNVKTPFTVTLPSTIIFLETPIPPLNVTLAEVEFDAPLTLAKTI